MKWWLHGTYLAVIALVLFFSWWPDSTEPEKEAKQTHTESDSDDSLELTQQQVPVAPAELTPPTTPQRTAHPTTTLSTDAEPEQTSLTNELLHQMQQAEIQQKIDELDSMFQRETIDQGWAIQQEQNLRDLFIQNEELRDLTINSVDCRESLCRVEMALDGADSLTTMMTIQRAIIRQSWHDEEARTYLRNADESDYHYTLFTER